MTISSPALAGVAWPAELFVDQKHPEASDKNAGTEAKPFKTTQAAVDKVQAGDTIWVKAGDYEDKVKRTGEARPMLADTGVECRWPGMPEAWDARSTPASFWRVADGNYNVMPLVGYNPGFPFYPYWQPQSTAGYGLGENAGCRWYIDAEAKFPQSIGDMNMPKTTHDAWPNRPTWSNGNHWLVMVGLTPEKMLPQGVGYWSPHLSTAPGAKVTVSLKMRGKASLKRAQKRRIPRPVPHGQRPWAKPAQKRDQGP
jgi:hypothetical protein